MSNRTTLVVSLLKIQKILILLGTLNQLLWSIKKKLVAAAITYAKRYIPSLRIS